MINTNKSMLASTFNETGSHANLIMNECEKYGSTYGCDTDCTAFWKGNCDVPEENVVNFSKSCDKEEIELMKKLYPETKKIIGE